MAGWQDIARRAMVGEKHPLASANGELFVCPKKLPQRVADEIASLQMSALMEDGSVEKIKRLRAAKKKADDEHRELTEEEQVDLLPSIPEMPPGQKDKIARLCLQFGIWGHNFPNGDDSLIGGGQTFDDGAITGILEWGPMAAEITEVVTVHNRPLLEKKQGNSPA
jgi:hypothetical protein